MPARAATEERPAVLLAVHSARMGGAQLMALAAAERLAPSYDLHIAIARGPLTSRFEAFGRKLRACPTMTFGWGSASRWGLQAARSVIDAVRIAGYVRRHRIRAVHTNSTVLLGPVLGARLARVPVIVHARELPSDARSRLLFRLLGALADTVVVVSGAVEAAFPGARARLVRISDGIDVPAAPVRASSFHKPVRLCLIGTVNGDGRKGQDIAVEAVAALAARGVPARLSLVGPIQEASSAEALKAQAAALGVEDSVEVTGPSDRIDDVIAAHDILLSCARMEPLGLTVMEALARDTPVVASRVGGVREIVRDGETGILVPAEDPEATAEAIVALLGDPDGTRAMARRGREDVAARYDRTAGLAALEAEVAGAVER
jgi:glycosyltransferase involved in cell wall biosynthesis